MVVVRGINVFPTTIAATLMRFRELSGEYRIRLKDIGPYDRLPIDAELAPEQVAGAELAAAIEAAIKRDIGVTALVSLLPPLSLPRTAGKTKRVFRE